SLDLGELPRARSEVWRVGARNVVQVDSEESLRNCQAEPRRHAGAPITALRSETLVAELRHQLAPQLPNPSARHTRLARPIREAVAGQRRHDEIESVGRIGAAGSRIGEQRDDFEKFEDRPGPSVSEKERQRIGSLAAYVEVVDVEAADAGSEIRKGIDSVFPLPPVELRTPVGDEILQVFERKPVVPAGLVDLIRPTRRGQPPG